MVITCFPQLDQLLSALTKSAKAVLGSNFSGAYLQGSFAVGGADEDSDVDFLIAIAKPLGDEEVKALNAMHKSLHRRKGYWSKHLEGSYVPLAALRRYESNQPFWHYLDNGSSQLELSNHDNTNVVRWSLREYGVVLAGPPPHELVDEVSAEALRAEIRAVIMDWGNELLAEPESLDNGWRQPYVVLSFCRMLHSLATGRVDSKLASAHWAQTALEGRWQGLIERAQTKRKGQFDRVWDIADPGDYRSTIEFIRYAQSLTLTMLAADGAKRGT
jgi:predicted nucleotidyltransferase